jgi:hypothetical protein
VSRTLRYLLIGMFLLLSVAVYRIGGHFLAMNAYIDRCADEMSPGYVWNDELRSAQCKTAR